jgi:hypothetical protein
LAWSSSSTGRIDDALADPRGVVVDEADDRVREVALVENLPRHLARGLAGADHQDALLHLERAAQVIEEQAPAENGHQEHEQRRHEDAVADHQRRDDEIQRREHDRGGAHRLQQPDDQLAVRVDQGEVVEVVVVEAELADDGDQDDLPQAPADRAPLKGGRQRHRPEDQQQFGAEHGEAAGRDVPIKELHDRGPGRQPAPAPS